MSLIDKVLKERYKLTELIAEGGMASVFKGTDLLLQRTVAVKILRQNLALDEDGIERFYREARSAAKLSHPNIVNIYDIGQEDDIYFIVMEYLPGGTLDKLISGGKPPVIDEVIRIGIEICEALDYAHKKGVIHRDIKAQNIMQAEDKTIRVVDFGIARVLDTGTMTKPGTVMGSVYYFSPEQAEGKETSISSDIYSTGVLLYYLSTAHYPFDGETAVSIALKHIKDQPVPPVTFNTDIEEKLQDIILRAMNKSPEDRYKTACDMAEELKFFKKPNRTDKVDKDTIERLKSYDLDTEKTVIRKAPPAIPKQEKKIKTVIKKKQKNLTPLIIGIVVILTAIILAGIPYIKKHLNYSSVKVPLIIGKTEEQARSELSDVNLKLEIISTKNDDEIPEGKIISQEPKEGTPVKAESQVRVIVSLGKGKIEVPDITGKSLDDAKAELAELGLEIYVDEEEVTDKYLPGTVMLQQPLSGTKVDDKSKIKVKISKKLEEVVIPDLSGLTEEEATRVLMAKELKLKVSGTRHSDIEKGLIISQDPPAGEKKSKNSQVSVFTSSGQDMITVPDITGLTLGQAREKLKETNLNIKLEEGQIAEDDNTLIETQSPPSGDKILSGGTIEVTIKQTPVMTTVPNLLGKLLFDAKNDLTGRDLTVGTVTESPSDDVPGTVLQQDPESGTQVTAKTSVNLVVAKIKDSNVIVPDLKGLTVSAAIGELEKVKLKTGDVIPKVSSEKKGSVISHDPPAGTGVLEGSTVNLEISQ